MSCETRYLYLATSIWRHRLDQVWLPNSSSYPIPETKNGQITSRQRSRTKQGSPKHATHGLETFALATPRICIEADSWLEIIPLFLSWSKFRERYKTATKWIRWANFKLERFCKNICTRVSLSLGSSGVGKFLVKPKLRKGMCTSWYSFLTKYHDVLKADSRIKRFYQAENIWRPNNPSAEQQKKLTHIIRSSR